MVHWYHHSLEGTVSNDHNLFSRRSNSNINNFGCQSVKYHCLIAIILWALKVSTFITSKTIELVWFSLHFYFTGLQILSNEILRSDCQLFSSLAPSWLGSRFDNFKLESTVPIPVSSALTSSFHLPFTGLQAFQPPAPPSSPKKKEPDEIWSR